MAEIPEEIRPEVEQLKADLKAVVDENKRLKEEAPKHIVNGWRAAMATFLPVIKGEN